MAKKDPTLPKTKLDKAREGAQYQYNHAISSAIRVALAQTGLDSAEMARRCGMDRSTIYRFMCAERSLSLDALDKIFRALGFGIEVLAVEMEGGALESAQIVPGEIVVKGIVDYEEKADESSARGDPTFELSPTYLSRVERGQLLPPAEDKVLAIARELDQDPDVLLAMAGRVASDVTEVIKRHPGELVPLIRSAGKSFGKSALVSSVSRQMTAPDKTCIFLDGNDPNLFDRFRQAVEEAKKDGKHGNLLLVIDNLDAVKDPNLFDRICQAVEEAK